MPISSAGPSSPELANRNSIIERIEREAGVPHLANILTNRLAPTDLQSLLLQVYSCGAKKRDPKALLEDHVSNRFTRPSASSPLSLLEWDRIAFSRLPKVFQPVELSPVCPLGTVSVLLPIVFFLFQQVVQPFKALVPVLLKLGSPYGYVVQGLGL